MDRSPPLLFDTHVHLDCFLVPDRLDSEILLARRAGVRGFVVPGVAPSGWPALHAAVARTPGALAAPGVHPLAAGEWRREAANELESLLDAAVAVGEIGLDGMPAAPSRAEQERAFRAQLQLAIAARRPALIHCRGAMGRVLEILRAEGAQRIGGIFHAFSGSLESALAAIRLNFAIGVGGPITYPGARRGPEVVRDVPAEWLVLETDAPDLAPVPHRGGDNRPAYLPLIAERVATLRNWSLAETARLTTANARRILHLEAFDPEGEGDV